jgi:UDP-glucose 4-epimerase
MTIKQRTVLVTGGTGFIGRHLVRRLVDDSHEVTLLQRSAERVAGATEVLRIEEFAPTLIDRALAQRRFDWVFHLASYGVRPHDRQIEPMFRVNVEATRHIVQSAVAWSPHAVVIAGTGSEYRFDGVERPVTEDHPLEPYKPYGASKAAGTLCAAATARAALIPFAACRLFAVYGLNEAPHRLFPTLLRGFRSKTRVALSPGHQKRDLLFIDDAVDAFVAVARALESAPQQVILNICSGIPVTVRAFAETAARIYGTSLELLGFGEISIRPDEVMYFAGDPTRSHAFTGWRPRFDLERGIKRSIEQLLEAV